MVLTSCGRQDLLQQTLDSFLRFNTYPLSRIVIIEDGEEQKNAALERRYAELPFSWVSTGSRVGQIRAIDMAYAHVDSEYIFHCEDDWEFYAGGFIEKSLEVLSGNRAVLQVWLRALNDTNRHPIRSPLLHAKGVPYRLMQTNFASDEWGTWHGFTFNPGLRRTSDAHRLTPFASIDPSGGLKSWEIERELGTLYRRLGLVAAILADRGGHGYVKHIGWQRRVAEAT